MYVEPDRDSGEMEEMDVLTHVFLPLTLIYVVRRDFNEKLFPLALLAVLPDFDVFTGIHRGLFHSLVFLAPLSALIIGVEYAVSKRLRYSPIALFFLYSHLALDFLAGGVPFLYPFVELGVGVEFPFVIKFGGSVSIVDVVPKLVYCYPQPVHGEVNAFSGFGVASALLFVAVYWSIGRQRRSSETKRSLER